MRSHLTAFGVGAGLSLLAAGAFLLFAPKIAAIDDEDGDGVHIVNIGKGDSGSFHLKDDAINLSADWKGDFEFAADGRSLTALKGSLEVTSKDDGEETRAVFKPGRLRPVRLLWLAVIHVVWDATALLALAGLSVASGFGWRRGSPAFQRAHYVLAGWFLTDDPTHLAKWRFPNVGLLPDKYLVASGRLCKLEGSFLYDFVTNGKHHDVKLSGEDLLRLTIWQDNNCNFLGAYHETERQVKGELVLPDAVQGNKRYPR